jgi:hypothetical protein
MSITVTIAGVDKSASIDWDSLSVEQQVTSQVDSASFRIKKHAGKTYAPVVGDEVTVDDGATRIFGGTITRIDVEQVATLVYQSIQCVSHERSLDRYLVVREITNRNVRYILNTIIAEFVNRKARIMDTMESTETWTNEDGTTAANTTNGQFILNEQSLKFTATASNTATARRSATLDLTAFDDGSAAAAGDIIKFFAYVDTPANLASIRIRVGMDAGATYTNYYEYTYSTALTAGWNEIALAKSAFTPHGSPDWANAVKRQFRVTASAGGTVRVSIDDVRLVEATTYIRQTGVRDADTPFLGSVKFNYEQASAAIKDVAEAVGNDWYIDPDRVLCFYQPASIPAPFSLTDGSANFLWNTVKLTADLSTIKNQIFVRGGEYQGTSTTYSEAADGEKLNYASPYKLKGISVTVAGSAKTVGVDNLNDPASYDCLYNFMEKTLKFKTATKPTAGQVVAMTGNPMIPIIIKKGDPTSISAHGVFEFLVVDKSIITLQGGRDRASAELKNYRNTLQEGEFRTDVSGLRAGQTIRITLTNLAIDETFVIKAVQFSTRSPSTFFYDVKLVSTRSFGIIEYLLQLLRNDKKKIDVNDDELIDLALSLDETVACADAYTQMASALSTAETAGLDEATNQATDAGTVFVAGPYTPVNFADTKRVFLVEGSLLG